MGVSNRVSCASGGGGSGSWLSTNREQVPTFGHFKPIAFCVLVVAIAVVIQVNPFVVVSRFGGHGCSGR